MLFPLNFCLVVKFIRVWNARFALDAGFVKAFVIYHSNLFPASLNDRFFVWVLTHLLYSTILRVNMLLSLIIGFIHQLHKVSIIAVFTNVLGCYWYPVSFDSTSASLTQPWLEFEEHLCWSTHALDLINSFSRHQILLSPASSYMLPFLIRYAIAQSIHPSPTLFLHLWLQIAGVTSRYLSLAHLLVGFDYRRSRSPAGRRRSSPSTWPRPQSRSRTCGSPPRLQRWMRGLRGDVGRRYDLDEGSCCTCGLWGVCTGMRWTCGSVTSRASLQPARGQARKEVGKRESRSIIMLVYWNHQ